MVIIVVNGAFRKDRGWDRYRQPPNCGRTTEGGRRKLLNQSETYRALLRDLASDPLQPEGTSR